MPRPLHRRPRHRPDAASGLARSDPDASSWSAQLIVRDAPFVRGCLGVIYDRAAPAAPTPSGLRPGPTRHRVRQGRRRILFVFEFLALLLSGYFAFEGCDVLCATPGTPG